MSAELTREQLLEYVKKQRLKIKKLEADLDLSKQSTPSGPSEDGDKLAELVQTIQALESQVRDKDGLLQAKEGLLKEQAEQLSKNNSLFEQLKNEYERYQAESGQKLAQSQQNLKLLTDDMAAAEEEKWASMEKVAALEDKLMNMRRDRERKGGEEAQSMQQVDALTADLQAVRLQLQEKEAAFQTICDDLKSITSQRDGLQSKCADMLAQHTSDLEVLQASHVAVLAERAVLQKALSEEQLTSQRLTAESAQQAAQAQSLRDELLALQAQYEAIKALEAAVAEQSAASAAPVAPTESIEVEGSGSAKEGGKKKKKGGKGAAATPSAPTPAPISTAAPTATPVDNSKLMAELSAELSAAQATIAALQAAAADHGTALAAAQSASAVDASMQEELEITKQKVAELHEHNLLLEKRLSEMKEQFDGVQHHLEKILLVTQTASLPSSSAVTTASNSTNEMINAIEEEIQKSLTTYQKQIAQLSAELETAQQSMLDKDQTILQLTAEERQLDQMRRTLIDKNSALEEQLLQKDALLSAGSDQQAAQVVELSNQLSDLQATLKEKEETIVKLSDEIVSNISEKDSLIESLQDEKAALTAKLLAAMQDTASADLLKAAEAEIADVKGKLLQKEEMAKKLTLKLKQKMKECDDLTANIATMQAQHTAALSEATVAANNSQTADALAVHVEEINSLKEKCTAYESKFKLLNQTLLVNEEKISSFLIEKNALRQEMSNIESQLSMKSKEYDNMKVERDMIRKQSQEREEMNNQHMNKISLLTAQVGQCTATIQALEKQVHALQADAAKHAADIQSYQVNEMKYMTNEERSRAMNEEKDKLVDKVNTLTNELAAKEESYQMNIRKLKALLNKVNQLSQEKDGKIAQLETLYVKRPAKIKVIFRLQVTAKNIDLVNVYNSHQAEHANLVALVKGGVTDYYYVQEEDERYRWIDQTTYSDWIEHGVMTNNQQLTNLLDIFCNNYSILSQTYQNEVSNLRGQYNTLQETFNTYKTRAQTALKRINQEERDAKTATQSIEDLQNAISRLEHDLEARSKELRSTQEQGKRTEEEKAAQISGLEKLVDTLQHEKADVEEALAVLTKLSKKAEDEQHHLQDQLERVQAEYEAREKVLLDKIAEVQQHQAQYSNLSYLNSLAAPAVQPAEPIPVVAEAVEVPKAVEPSRLNKKSLTIQSTTSTGSVGDMLIENIGSPQSGSNSNLLIHQQVSKSLPPSSCDQPVRCRPISCRRSMCGC